MRKDTLEAGVVGWPVAHSRSPQIFRHWFRRYGIAGRYDRHALEPEAFEEGVRHLLHEGFRGCNVTVPHKESAFGIADIRTETANRIGSVNTLVFHADGRIEGDSTDGYGFLEALRQGVGGKVPVNGPSVILGAGGAARAVADSLADAGAPEVRIVNRTITRAQRLAEEIPGPLVAVAVKDAEHALHDARLVVNTTSLGMQGGAPLFVDSTEAPREAVVMDLVYSPLETEFLGRARAAGQRVIDGLGMLLHQARPGFHRWFGVDPEVDASLRKAALESPAP